MGLFNLKDKSKNEALEVEPQNGKSVFIPVGKPLFSKIDCYVVLTDRKTKSRPKVLGHRKVSMGSKEFTIWHGDRQRRYRIDYEQLIEGSKTYLYFTDVLNAVGALSFYEYPAKKYEDELDSRNSELMLYDDAVKFFQGRKGIPALWLVILGIGMMAGVIGMLVLVQLYMAEARASDSFELQVTNLKAQIATLQSATNNSGNSGGINQGGGIIR